MGTELHFVRTKTKYFYVMKLAKTTEFTLMITKNVIIKHLGLIPCKFSKTVPTHNSENLFDQ
jgi:hypothetical protein